MDSLGAFTIARDGTIYLGRDVTLDRLHPDGTVDRAWVTVSADVVLPPAPTSLALDAANRWLYVAIPSSGIYAIDLLAKQPVAAPFVTAATSPTYFFVGLTSLLVGPDGALWAADSNFTGVIRIDASTKAIQFVAPSLRGLMGLAFRGDGSLLVTSSRTHELTALTLDAVTHQATMQETVVTGLDALPLHLAVDDSGTIVVASIDDAQVGRVSRYGVGATQREIVASNLRLSEGSTLELGTGALGCTDLYASTLDGLVRFEGMHPQVGAVWH
jgi:DNA-binding beta-propeller fold protein YncE